MGRSQESFSKKEREKKKVKKKKDKLQKKEERKLSSEKGKDFDDMIAYVDEFGNITSTPPPEPDKSAEIKAEDIEVSIPKNENRDEPDAERRGTVTFYNESKGFGFIRDHQTGESLFFHVNNVVDQIGESDKVSFLAERGPRGMNAVNVRLG